MFKSCQKKGQAALISGLVFGIASLVVGVIIAFIVVSTLTGANLLQDQRTTTTVTNETGAWLNATDYTLSQTATNRLSYTLTAIWAKETGEYDVSVPLVNATVSSEGVVSRAGDEDYDDVSYSYTYVTKTNEEVSADAMSGNLTSGVDNVSSKIPTVLLIAAIVLILGILVLLVGAWQRMRIGGGSI